MPKLPQMGVQAVVGGYNDYLRMMGGMSKATSDTHGVLGGLSVIPLAGGLVKGAAMATAAIVAIGTAAVGAGVAIGGMLLKIAEEAAPMLEMEQSFERLNQRAGTAGEATLALWQNAVRGTVPAIKLMEIYNTAARLLGDEFAQKLPEAMALLSDAATQTGSDVTVFTTTFIKGIARLRVGALAQLGIQIDLNQLTEDYAKSLGVKADAITDAQKRELLYAESVRQLTADLEGLRSTGDEAEEAFERLNVTMTDARNEVKMAISKAMLPLGVKFGQLAKVYLPGLVEGFKKNLIPIIEKAAQWFGTFLPKAILKLQIWWYKLAGAMKPLTDYIRRKAAGAWTWLAEVVFPAVVTAIDKVIDWIVKNMPKAIETVKEWAIKVREWAQKVADFWNNELGPRLKTAWQWIVDEVWPKVETVVGWLSTNIPLATQGLIDFWNNELGPRLKTAWQWIVDEVAPKVEIVRLWLADKITIASQTLMDFWNNDLGPSLLTAWQWIVDNVGPKVQDVIDWLQVKIPIAVDIAKVKWDELKLTMASGASEWQTTTLPAIRDIVEELGVKLSPILTIAKNNWEIMGATFKTVTDFIGKIMMPIWGALAKVGIALVVKALEGLVYIWLTYLLPAAETLSNIMTTALIPWFTEWRRLIDDLSIGLDPLVGWLEDLATNISNIGVPKALQQNSPSPLEKSLMGVRDQLVAINALGMPSFGGKNFSPVIAGPGAGAMAGGGGSNSSYNLTVNTSAPREQITADFGMMRALARRR